MTAPLTYNPLSRALADDPYPTYRRLRDEAPVFHNADMDFWALSRYDDVLAASLDAETFVNREGTTLEGLSKGMLTLLGSDGQLHRSQRLVLTGRFKPNAVASLEPRVRRLSADLLDAVGTGGTIDLVSEFAGALPMVVISELMDLPAEQRDLVHKLCNAALDRDEANDGVAAVPEKAAGALFELLQFFIELASARRARPGEDVVSVIAAAHIVDNDGTKRPLEDWEVATRCVELTVAGFETVMKLISTGALRLLEAPDQRRALVDDVTVIPNAIEELLRLDPPSQYQGRWVDRDVTLHDVTIPADSRVLLVTGAACRDERVYTDPDALDVRRDVGRQLAFGYGAHLCLGAALARLEARVAFEELLSRSPEYTIDTDRLVRAYSSNVRGYASVPATL